MHLQSFSFITKSMERFRKFLMFQAMKVPTQIRSKLAKKKTNTIKQTKTLKVKD